MPRCLPMATTRTYQDPKSRQCYAGAPIRIRRSWSGSRLPQKTPPTSTWSRLGWATSAHCGPTACWMPNGVTAVVRAEDRVRMAADGLSEADIEAVRNHLAMLRINELVLTK